MVAQMWWSFDVSVPMLVDKEFEKRKSEKPKLGNFPKWGELESSDWLVYQEVERIVQKLIDIVTDHTEDTPDA